MKHIDFFAELIAEATGTTTEQARATLDEYAANHEYNPILDKEVDPATVEKGRALIKSDPKGFLRRLESGLGNILSGFTTH